MEWIKQKQELAKALDISRPTLDRFLKMEGAPTADPKKGWNLEAVTKFVLEHTSKESIAANLDDSFDKLKKWDIYERARKTKIANDFKEGRLILVERHKSEISQMASECQAVLNAMAPRLAPDVVGCTVAEAERRIQLAVDEAVQKLHHG
jgi:hypothetical protein